MNITLKAGLASTVLALAIPYATEAFAADLGGGGSIKDSYAAAPVMMGGGAGNCYFRGDVGYSVSQEPSVTWPVNNGTFDYNDADTDGFADGDTNRNGVVDYDEIVSVHVTDQVTNVSLENTWLAEGGIGCGSGSRGFRIEAMLGYRGDRKLDGEPGIYDPGPSPGDPTGVVPPPAPIDDPLHTSLQTYTLMLNVYKDLGNFGGFTPYIGAGAGVAYHMVDNVYFTGNPALTNQIHGDNDLSFAWSLMAGVGYQLSERAILDLGYRYIDMGKAGSQRSDTAGFVNPRVNIDDIEAHEFKVGLRYHFGQSDCCGYGPMK